MRRKETRTIIFIVSQQPINKLVRIMVVVKWTVVLAIVVAAIATVDAARNAGIAIPLARSRSSGAIVPGLTPKRILAKYSSGTVYKSTNQPMNQ
jgi:hypothetical protein